MDDTLRQIIQELYTLSLRVEEERERCASLAEENAQLRDRVSQLTLAVESLKARGDVPPPVPKEEDDGDNPNQGSPSHGHNNHGRRHRSSK